MEKFSLTSALVGGFITAAFSYVAWIIRKYVSARDERKRVAYFYLVKVCEISAIKKTVESVFKQELSELKNKIGDEKYPFHMLCAGLSELLKNRLPLASEESKLFIQNIGILLNNTNVNKEDCFGYKVENEIVSKFPQSAILNYHFLINYLRQLQTSLSLWSISFEKADFSMYTPEYLYGQIECVKNIVESAEYLIVSLAHESGIKNNEVNNIIAKQVKEYSTNAIRSKFNKQITDIYLEMINKKPLTPKQEGMPEAH